MSETAPPPPRERQVTDLIESEERLRFALAAAGLGQWDMDLATGKASRTPRHDEIFGYSSLLPEWTYQHFLEHVLPEDREAVDLAFSNALATSTWDIQCRIRRADGAIRHIWTKALIQRGADGAPGRMLGIVGDDTDRRRDARAAVDHAQRLELLDAIEKSTRNASDPLEVMAISSRLLGEHLRVMRCAYGDFEPGSLRFTVRGDWAMPGIASIDGAYRLGDFGSRVAAELRNGRTLVMDDVGRESLDAEHRALFQAVSVKAVISCPLIKDGQLVAMMAAHSASPRAWTEADVETLVAVTERSWAHVERLRARVDLSHREAQLRHLLSALPGAIFTAGPDGTINYMSRWMYDFCGRDPAGPGFVLAYWSEIVHPGDLQGHVDDWMNSLATGSKLSRASRMRHADGSYHWFSVVADPAVDADGRVLQWHGYAVNIQDRMEALEQLSASEQALREADRRKDEFLATLAHELRNPLAPLRHALDLMRMAPDDRKIVGSAREVMTRQLSQMVHLVDDLLDVSRVSRGVIELKRECLQLLVPLQSAIEMSRPLIEECGHTLAVLPPPETALVNGDVTRLTQVFCNLLNNAAKYTDRGGHIWIETMCADGMVTISVRDDGIGIPAAMLPKVFDLFSQVDGSLQRTRGGLGIGLMLARKLVEMHGGSIDACSAGANAGSTFRVRLPLVTPPSEPEVPEVVAETAGQPRLALRILVADDNVDSADGLGMTLDLMGHETRVAYDGQQTLLQAESFRPQVMVLDLGMPLLSGLDIARQVRAAPWGRNITLIALSGWGQDQDRRRSREAGFDVHLVKPVDVMSLVPLFDSLAR